MERYSLRSMLKHIFFGLGLILGFYGSLVLYIGWPVAVLLGVLTQIPMSNRDFFPMRLVLSMSIGIGIGGIPVWLSASSWTGILFTLTTAALFFGSAMLTRFYLFCRNFKFQKHDDLGQPPSDKGGWHRLLLSFKFKQKKSDNGQFLQSVITPIA